MSTTREARFARPSMPTAEITATVADLRAIARDAAVRAALAVGLGGIAVIHAVDSVGKWSETRYIFWLYMALIVAAIAVAAATLFRGGREVFLLAAGLAAAVMAAYAVSRTVGLPGAGDDVGNWTEPLGLASLVVEGLVVAVGLGAWRAVRRAA